MSVAELQPACQVAYCNAEATELLRSKQTGSEYHLCAECASGFYAYGWELVRGTVDLKPAPEGVRE
jgi:hypothetical protein